MSKKYKYRYRFRFNGEQHNVYANTKSELIRKVSEKKKDLETASDLSRRLTVIQWRDEWLEMYKKDKVQPNTFSTYKYILDRLDFVMPLDNVQPIDLQRILNDMAGMSDSLIHKFAVLVKEMFEDALDNELVASNPARKLSVPKGYTRARRPLTASERHLIEEVAPMSDAGSYVALMLYAGCRPSEAGGVQGKDIDLKNRTLHIRGTKTTTADRYVPISDKLLPYLQGLKKEEYAVKNTRGEKTSPDSRQNMWQRFRRELNIAAGAPVGRPNKHTPWDIPLEDLLAEDLQPYLLRHTFCTDLEAAGVPINVARDLMGHSSITITSKIYTHRTDAAFDDAAKKINRYDPEIGSPQGSPHL